MQTPLEYWREARDGYVDYFGPHRLALPPSLTHVRNLALVEIDWAIVCLEAVGDDPERLALVHDMMGVRFGGVAHGDIRAMLCAMLRVTRTMAQTTNTTGQVASVVG